MAKEAVEYEVAKAIFTALAGVFVHPDLWMMHNGNEVEIVTPAGNRLLVTVKRLEA